MRVKDALAKPMVPALVRLKVEETPLNCAALPTTPLTNVGQEFPAQEPLKLPVASSIPKENHERETRDEKHNQDTYR